ncbi:hypothetical protein LBMAG09_03260 [Actinomycetes bacterium]|nr:hypothetical protein LBMAG09_03260 [Actinomycetes bacterium]
MTSSDSSTAHTRALNRTCSRSGCRKNAIKTLTYIYSDSTAVLGPLATYAEPHAYDLCEPHSEKMTVPMGWTVLQHTPDAKIAGPSDDDLMAIADAIRNVGKSESTEAQVVAKQVPQQEVGRRGHLRVLPS